jgi:hypothetical protein
MSSPALSRGEAGSDTESDRIHGAIEIGRLARLLSVSYYTLKREIAREHLESERVRLCVFIPYIGEYRFKNRRVVSLAALGRYLNARGFFGELPADLGVNASRAPLALGLKKLAHATGLSLRTLQRDIAAGELRPFRIARRVLVSQAEVTRYLEMRSLPRDVPHIRRE